MNGKKADRKFSGKPHRFFQNAILDERHLNVG